MTDTLAPGVGVVLSAGLTAMPDGREVKGCVIEFPAGPPDMTAGVIFDRVPVRVVLDSEYAAYRTLVAAAYRAICANGIAPIGRDGRSFYRVEKMRSEHMMAAALKSLGVSIADHAEGCASVKSKVADCDCHVADAAKSLACSEESTDA